MLRTCASRGSLLGLLLMMLLPGYAAGQGALIRGQVKDAESGAPLRGAEVRVVEAGATAVTDAGGHYRLAGVEPGVYTVEAALLGFLADQRALAVSAASDLELSFALRPAALRAPQVDVIGRSVQALERIPGSAAVITESELAVRIPLTGNEVLRSVPGVHVQEEEGLGLRANIGIRGLDPDRSRAVLILEDGVPVSLAPYGEPEMYYTPPIDRMARVEVVKGSGSILFGPQTVGGVINYVTPNPPAVPAATFDVRGGTGGFAQAQLRYGGTWSNVGAHVGVLRKQADDLRGLFFNVTDLTGKLALGLGGSELGLKLSLYDEESNSTYVGLTERMFAEDPAQHPAPGDRLWIRRYAGSATHEVDLGANAVLRTTAYGYTVARNWMRQDYNSGDAERESIVFRGTTGNRNREFEVLGVEPRLQLNHRWVGLQSELDAGFRLHYEHASDAHIVGSTPSARAGVVRDYEVRSGRALAAYLQNRFHLGDSFLLTPGLRAEAFAFDRRILRRRVQDLPSDVDIRSEDRLFELIPGLGASWLADDRLTVFAGAHRGFAPPRVKDAFVLRSAAEGTDELVSLQLDAERSWNFELGARARPAAGLELEATGFLLDFTNQIIAPSLSAGSVAQAEFVNQGATRHVGVESALAAELSVLAGFPLPFLVQLKHTWVDATFSAERLMQTPAGDTADVRANRLPYAPEHLLTGALALQLPAGIGLRTDVSYTSAQFADNFETVDPRPDGRVGRIPAFTVWNLAGTYEASERLELFATVKNLLDRTYIASRRPEGIKPGLPRTVSIGARATF